MTGVVEQTAPQKKGKSQLFWERIRNLLTENPGTLLCVNSYNHPTLAYRAKRDINLGLNPVFPESGQWRATLVKDEKNPFYGPRSNRLTYRFELFMIYTPPQERNV